MFCWYAFLAYGGVRSADSEIVFQTGQSLADRGTFAVSGLPTWPGFGIAKGIDGREYSVFGPLQSILLVPFIRAAELIDGTGWYVHPPFDLPISFHVSPESIDASMNGTPLNTEPNALRFLVSIFNVIVGALTVMIVFRLLRTLKLTPESSIIGAAAFGAGSMFQACPATMMTEPLSTLLAAWSFLCIIPTDNHISGRNLFISGAILGLALAAHATAALFIPFYLIFVFVVTKRNCKAVMIFLGGMFIPAVLLCWFNFSRFGNIFETGRTVDPDAIERYGYGYFVAPWEGLLGLFGSAGKSIILYSPIVILGATGWPVCYRKHRALALTVLGIVAARIIFIASRFDWNGGFCLGPRLLVPMLPFVLIPFAVWVNDKLASGDWRKLRIALGFAAICMIEQWYFSIGEIFTFYHGAVKAELDAGLNILKGRIVYFSPRYSPLIHILNSSRGPFALRWLPLSNEMLFLIGSVVILFLLVVKFRKIYYQMNTKTP